MQEIISVMKEKAAKLLAEGQVRCVLGWKRGEFFYESTPAVFESAEELEELVYDDFCGPNLAKYLIRECAKEGKILVFAKPCDTYSINALIREHRVDREKLYVVGVECAGNLDVNKIRAKGLTGLVGFEDNGDTVTVKTLYGDETFEKGELLLERCLCCKGKEHKIADETIVLNEENTKTVGADRFSEVARLEEMTADERFEYWREQLSRCIRCNACRNVCPACSCIKCVFDNDDSGIASKANTDTFEENMFHIIRAFHVTGRCTDCGECSRVCPQNIPLQLLNRKFIKDYNELYGEYVSGEDSESKPPLLTFTQEDAEPSVVKERGNC
ncbi:MAG: 4Fe-4S dicluster domain-containing protein [Clostridia bacterium]|nr:4Fe-4S dicluster domain-containing protein [Clostridia bacterium]